MYCTLNVQVIYIYVNAVYLHKYIHMRVSGSSGQLSVSIWPAEERELPTFQLSTYQLPLKIWEDKILERGEWLFFFFKLMNVVIFYLHKRQLWAAIVETGSLGGEMWSTISLKICLPSQKVGKEGENEGEYVGGGGASSLISGLRQLSQLASSLGRPWL